MPSTDGCRTRSCGGGWRSTSRRCDAGRPGVGGASGYTFGFTARADSPYRTFNDYIEAARKEPGRINYGSTGTGTSPHLLVEEIAINARVTLNHVPVKGDADLMQALLGGQVMAQSDATGWDKFVDGGQMRLLVTFGENRAKRWPTVPTAKALGYGVVSSSPYGLAAVPHGAVHRGHGQRAREFLAYPV